MMRGSHLFRQHKYSAYRKIRHASVYKYFLKVLFVLSCVIFTIVVVIPKHQNVSSLTNSVYDEYVAEESFFNGQPRNVEHKRIDWHDYEHIEYEAQRQGPGEHGKPFKLEKEDDIELNKKLFKENGYAAVVSDMIALNRSLPDLRHPECRKKHYLQELPKASLIVIFYNEHLSTLLRTLYSVINRSPPHLLKEIVLVNDFSTKPFLWKPLQDYVEEKLVPKVEVKLINLQKRSGLMSARMVGARAATGDVLIVLDSHSEVSVNWLPPLLEPIAEDYRTCVCPVLDIIDFDTFEYHPQNDGMRGAFDWDLYYKRLPLRPQDKEDPTKPFESPIMSGGHFAISAKFFWELGGYDEGLDIWGAEQYELSFKIWQCGGRMVDAPCSRCGHMYRSSPFPNPRGINYLARNNKRVVEVWMDEYKQYVYERNPVYAETDAGDLTKQKALREKLQCKPFKHFLEEVAPDLVQQYPFRVPTPFASGTVKNLANPKMCLDTLGHQQRQPVGVFECAANKTHPHNNQMFTLRYHRDIQANGTNTCLDFSAIGAEVVLFPCHENLGNQLWRYDLENQQLRQGTPAQKRCLDLVGTKVIVADCDKTKQSQRWEWGFVNITNLNNWETYGAIF